MRNKRLDILRCLAVLVVVMYHSGAVPVVAKMGWAGVDLFFVLSGFLISGLLYSEHKKTGSINFKRFFIRRSLKIYPAFYAMLLVTFFAELMLRAVASPGAYLREILFAQSYTYGIWQHTWSLAVEEHFYIFLPIFLLIVIRFSSNRQDPFRVIPLAFVVIATICLLLRTVTIYWTPATAFHSSFVWNPTHDRMDSLFFGVFLGYLHHFRPEIIEQLFRPARNRIAIGVLTALLLSVCFLFTRESHFLLTFGLSFMYLGFGGLLLLSLNVRNVLPPCVAALVGTLGTVCAFVGVYSYSIYLWHIPFGAYAPGVVRRTLHLQMAGIEAFAFNIIGSIALGILMARIIEFPVIHLRDRFFPPMQKSSGFAVDYTQTGRKREAA
jgi:peptidoglycan/LPS O-acetylase OafA/YrhL